MIGIYKITSPTKKVYIGKSINIERRFKNYKRLACKTQPILYKSLKKYGAENHKFEIVCECIESELNNLERYYQDLYSVINKNGMNCILTITDENKSKNFFIKREKRKKELIDRLKRKEITDIIDSIIFK